LNYLNGRAANELSERETFLVIVKRLAQQNYIESADVFKAPKKDDASSLDRVCTLLQTNYKKDPFYPKTSAYCAKAIAEYKKCN
jgi:hypothetical protein